MALTGLFVPNSLGGNEEALSVPSSLDSGTVEAHARREAVDPADPLCFRVDW